jgi:hypothetical protein
MNPQQKKDFRPIDVPDPSDDCLVKQQLSDRRFAFVNPTPDPFRIGIAAERIFSQFRPRLEDPLAIEQFTLVGPVQVQRIDLADHSNPDRTARLRRGTSVPTKFTVQSEMHV